jgi:protein O-mannosyl-transferase
MVSGTVTRNGEEKRVYSSAAVLLFFCAGALLLYFPILGRSFASDDFQVVRRVGLYRQIRVPGFFRPLSDVSLYGNYLLGGFNPVGYYLFNILVHGVNSFFVFLFCYRWKWADKRRDQYLYAWIAGLFFLAYPFHSEGIDWVIGRGASLSVFFGLAALVILTGEMREGWKMGWAGVGYFLGMAVYEPVIFLPAAGLLVLYEKGATTRVMLRWGGLFAGILFLHIWVRIGVAGKLAGEYGSYFFSAGWTRYLANAAKVGGRLFLPPGEQSGRQVLLFSLVLAALSILTLLVYRGAGRGAKCRRYLRALLLMTGVTCILPVITAVSTKTSESDRMLYFPSVFLCCGLSFLLIRLLGNGRLLRGVVILILGYMVLFLERGNTNWIHASAITRQILGVVGRQPARSRVFVMNLPDEYDGAYIFRLGFPEAVLMSGRDTAGLTVVNHLTRDKARGAPGRIGLQRGPGGEVYIAPNVTIRPWKSDSLQIDWVESLPDGGKHRMLWLAAKEDKFLYWDKKEMVEYAPR